MDTEILLKIGRSLALSGRATLMPCQGELLDCFGVPVGYLRFAGQGEIPCGEQERTCGEQPGAECQQPASCGVPCRLEERSLS